MNYDEKISLKNDTNMRLLQSYKFKVVFRYLEVKKKKNMSIVSLEVGEGLWRREQ